MTVNESVRIKKQLKLLVDDGVISQQAFDEVTSPRDTDGKPAKPDLVDRKQTCELLGLSLQTLVNYERSGDLKPIKIAGKRLVRYSMENICELLNGNLNNKR